MVELVERMLDPSASSGQALHKQLPKAKTPHEQESAFVLTSRGLRVS